MSGSIVAFPSTGAFGRAQAPSLRARIGAILKAVAHEWRVRHDLAQLSAMDARALRDIGLTRGGMEGAVREGRGWRSRGAFDEPIREVADRPAMPISWTEWR